MKLYGVKMMPNGLVSCQINQEEVRVIELAADGFAIRLAKEPEEINSVSLHFYRLQDSSYETVELTSYQIVERIQEEYYVILTVLTGQTEFKKAADSVIAEYSRYIDLKMNYEDSAVSQALTGYPAKEDEEFLSSYDEIKKLWSERLFDAPVEFDVMPKVEVAVSLDHLSSYQNYLAQPVNEYLKTYFNEFGMSHHPIAKRPVTRLYVGNQFCHHLFPSEKQLLSILTKAKSENLKVTLAFTYLREELIEDQIKLLEVLADWLRKNSCQAEIIINDWGMSQLVTQYADCMIPVLGVLLNKRRKDPRYQYKCGYEYNKQYLKENASNSLEFQQYLKDTHHITRYEYESCGYEMTIADGCHSLHLPCYQTNTSQFCGLYAKVTTNDRGNQSFVANCPHYCEKYVFAYPKHLNMVGRYNSIFGVDSQILKDGTLMKKYLKNGIDRIVINLME